jgi:hypothetical protein
MLPFVRSTGRRLSGAPDHQAMTRPQIQSLHSFDWEAHELASRSGTMGAAINRILFKTTEELRARSDRSIQGCTAVPPVQKNLVTPSQEPGCRPRPDPQHGRRPNVGQLCPRLLTGRTQPQNSSPLAVSSKNSRPSMIFPSWSSNTTAVARSKVFPLLSARLWWIPTG